jgi:diguanylate cyclase (GGDEF)-like protein
MEARTDAVYKIAVLDPLTGLYNRRSGEQRLAEEFARSQRHGNPLTVLMLDLNGLKLINDEFGHAAGDGVLKYFAERLVRAIRGSDLAIRLGGDEFLLVLPECKLEEVRHILHRLHGMNLEFDDHFLPVTFSAGWTNYTAGDSPEEMLKRADDALYVNKRSNRETIDFSMRAS